MQIENELKEILLDCWNNGSCYILYNKEKTFLDWLEENESKILALGKPEPLAKNKQIQKVCIDGKPHNHHILYCSECNQWVSSKGLQTE